MDPIDIPSLTQEAYTTILGCNTTLIVQDHVTQQPPVTRYPLHGITVTVTATEPAHSTSLIVQDHVTQKPRVTRCPLHGITVTVTATEPAHRTSLIVQDHVTQQPRVTRCPLHGICETTESSLKKVNFSSGRRTARQVVRQSSLSSSRHKVTRRDGAGTLKVPCFVVYRYQ
ncbi:hypothetical protein J6590_038627 [Homalodisca vitripennis]|nr:hypothetical protein J6590_038627 [Homalodisca vitripennis]